MKYEMTDVINARLHKDSGFEKLYISIYEDLYKMAFYIMGNKECAEDVVSETIIDAYNSISGLRDENKFEQWIIRILTVKCKRKFKEKYNKITVYNPQVSDLSEMEMNDEKSEKGFEHTAVRLALDKLSRDEKIIVTLSVVEGYQSKEIGKILSMNASTVRSKLNRSLKKMKIYLEV